MKPNETLPMVAAARLVPIQTLTLEVTEGPDAGRAFTSEGERVSLGTGERNDLVLTDPTVSRYHVELTRGPDGILIVDQGSKNGSLVGGVRVDRGLVAPGAVLRLGHTSVRVGDGEKLGAELYAGESLGQVRGKSPAMRRLMAQAAKAAQSDAHVLVMGESGTGKELVARALHDLSPRSRKPFETVDCGSLTSTLIASELFGHERGAFTGAERQHIGALERASGGTLFLDEIGELPAELQPALLGALGRQRIRRVGGRTDIDIDVRVVSATHRDLRAEVNSGTFRLDLFSRLAVITLRVPPLRERLEDIPLLLEHFASACRTTRPRDALFGDAELGALMSYHWPGNVRELRNLVEATVAMGELPELGSSPDAAAASPGADLEIASLLAMPYRAARATLLERFEQRYLDHLLQSAGGNVSRAARDANMDRSHLFTMLRRHRLR